MKLQPKELVEILESNCAQFTKQVQKNVLQYLETSFQISDADLSEPFSNSDDIHFSILFNGSVYGEFILSLNKNLAVRLTLGEDGEFDDHRDDVLDTFKEILNISVGKTIESLGKEFEHLSITSPKVTVGELYLPKLPISTHQLVCENDIVSCSLYIDQMKLTIASEYQEKSKKVEQSEVEMEQLRRLNKTKTEFLANMSHELRTPLNGMIGHLDLLKSTPLSSVQRRQVETVSVSSDFLLSIINDILEFSKIESGQMEIEEREFDFFSSFDQLVDMVSNQIYQKELDFFIKMDPTLPTTIVSDETRLKQVLMNLIGNAIKFTPKGFIEVVAENKKDQIKFSVRDTGVGIPKDKLKSIFNSFSQVDASDNRKYGGSGLGLTISKSIIEALGGELSVESQEAVGTVFSFTVPLCKGKKATPVAKTNKAEPKQVVAILGNKTAMENLSFYHETCLTNGSSAAELVTAESLDEIPEVKEAMVFVDWMIWSKESDDARVELLDRIESTNSSIHFLFQPSNLMQIEKQAEFLDGVPGSAIKYPLTPLKVYEACRPGVTLQFSHPEDTSKKVTEQTITKTNKVLLVEDNMINQQVAKSMLELIGLEVDIASDGQKAVELCKETIYDIIFMDCQMPIMDGYEATDNIRNKTENPNKETPIIALTANAFREIKERCFESGMTDFATKPIKKNSLEDLVKRYV